MNRRSLSVLFFILAIGVGWYFIFGMNVQTDRDRAAAKTARVRIFGGSLV